MKWEKVAKQAATRVFKTRLDKVYEAEENLRKAADKAAAGPEGSTRQEKSANFDSNQSKLNEARQSYERAEKRVHHAGNVSNFGPDKKG